MSHVTLKKNFLDRVDFQVVAAAAAYGRKSLKAGLRIGLKSPGLLLNINTLKLFQKVGSANCVCPCGTLLFLREICPLVGPTTVDDEI